MQNDIVKIVITAIVSAAVTSAVTYAGIVKQAVKSLKDGLLSLLKAEIIRSHDKYTRKGFCPIYAKDALEKAYTAYHNLGGNGAMTRLYEDIIDLPIEEANDE